MNIESEKIILYSREKHVKDNRRAFALKERGTTEALIYAKKKPSFRDAALTHFRRVTNQLIAGRVRVHERAIIKNREI